MLPRAGRVLTAVESQLIAGSGPTAGPTAGPTWAAGPEQTTVPARDARQGWVVVLHLAAAGKLVQALVPAEVCK